MTNFLAMERRVFHMIYGHRKLSLLQKLKGRVDGEEVIEEGWELNSSLDRKVVKFFHINYTV